ncbi:metal-dependent hydrolase [Paenibacillus sp. H1-7]|uniref:metal-dependent hydrolase n=1 Tax=Paenibacillus sp. H1-7 TaxID=2282849 RepID=UPI001EF783BE|nr:metal-dependent hydrolase [Paenibacillus sp. H1-7]ULL15866.1 metal-dependent hydrolase [Paenibacillus sp. H1-7]
MTGKTHLIVSTGVTLSVMQFMGQGITLASAAIAVISSLLPDIDEPNSLLMQKTMPKKLLNFIKLFFAAAGIGFIAYCYLQSFYTPYSYGAGALLIIMCLVNQRLFRQILMILLGGLLLYVGAEAGPWWGTAGALIMVCALLPHRGLTHSLYGVVMWGGLLYYASIRLGVTLWMAGTLSYTLHLLCDMLTKQGIHPLPPLKWKLAVPLMSTGKFSGFLVESVCITLAFVMLWNAFVVPMGLVTYSWWEQVKAVWSSV